MWDGPCRGCADHPRQQEQTSDVARFEWTGPRGGRFTLNGMTQTMAWAFSGLPLVAPTDFSGEYLMVFRLANPTPEGSVYQQESVQLVRLTRVAEPRTYETRVAPRDIPPWRAEPGRPIHAGWDFQDTLQPVAPKSAAAAVQSC